MQLFQAIILGLTQGITEFIPVSSSGHLILVGNYLQFEYSGLAFDMALDIGTLLALYLFFARDFLTLGHDLIWGGPKRRIAVYILLATIPGVIAGVMLQGLAESTLRSPQLVAINLIWVGVVMWIIDHWSRRDRGFESMNLPRAMVVGLAQVAALVPGISRSGATITAGRALGFDRVTAVRFSFWLSAPITTGATLKALLDGESLQQMSVVPGLYIAGILAAFVSGYIAARFVIGYLSRHGLGIFAAYRIVLGVFILVMGIR